MSRKSKKVNTPKKEKKSNVSESTHGEIQGVTPEVEEPHYSKGKIEGEEVQQDKVINVNINNQEYHDVTLNSLDSFMQTLGAILERDSEHLYLCFVLNDYNHEIKFLRTEFNNVQILENAREFLLIGLL